MTRNWCIWAISLVKFMGVYIGSKDILCVMFSGFIQIPFGWLGLLNVTVQLVGYRRVFVATEALDAIRSHSTENGALAGWMSQTSGELPVGFFDRAWMCRCPKRDRQYLLPCLFLFTFDVYHHTALRLTKTQPVAEPSP